MYRDIMNLKDKVIVVTGGTGLLGKEFCRGLAEFGAQVVIGSTNEENGKNVSDELNEELNDEKVFYLLLDITSESSKLFIILY